MGKSKIEQYTRDTLKARAVVMVFALPVAFIAFGLMLAKAIGVGEG